jgi:CheY-like chemotaxis protein
MQVKTILAIDDDNGIREIIKFSIEAMTGWKVVTAVSGSEGIAIAEIEQPDAILLDIMMPDMDGSTTFHHLQANAATKNIPTILLTAKAIAKEQQRLHDLGVAGAIAKPFKAHYLVKQICEILGWQI